MNIEEIILKRLKEEFNDKINKRVNMKFLETPYDMMYKDIVKILYAVTNESLDNIFYMLQEIFQAHPHKPDFKAFESRTCIKIPKDLKLAITNSVSENDYRKAIYFFYEFTSTLEKEYLMKNNIFK